MGKLFSLERAEDGRMEVALGWCLILVPPTDTTRLSRNGSNTHPGSGLEEMLEKG